MCETIVRYARSDGVDLFHGKTGTLVSSVNNDTIAGAEAGGVEQRQKQACGYFLRYLHTIRLEANSRRSGIRGKSCRRCYSPLSFLFVFLPPTKRSTRSSFVVFRFEFSGRRRCFLAMPSPLSFTGIRETPNPNGRVISSTRNRDSYEALTETHHEGTTETR